MHHLGNNAQIFGYSALVEVYISHRAVPEWEDLMLH